MELIRERINELDEDISEVIKAGLSTLHHSGVLGRILEEATEGFWKGDIRESPESLAERIVQKRQTFLPILELADLCEYYAKELAK